MKKIAEIALFTINILCILLLAIFLYTLVLRDPSEFWYTSMVRPQSVGAAVVIIVSIPIIAISLLTIATNVFLAYRHKDEFPKTLRYIIAIFYVLLCIAAICFMLYVF
jgi:hypothetical protein